MTQKGINLITCVVSLCLLTAIAVAWASASHFGECDETTLKTQLLSSCTPTIPTSGFGQLDVAPSFKASIKVPGLPTQLRRVSNNAYFNVSDGRAVHAYSRRQAWSADERLLDVGGKIIDAESLAILIEEIPVSSERVWSNTDANSIFGFRFAEGVLNEFVQFNVRTNQVDVLTTLSDQTKCSIGRAEGSQSNDDQYVLFVCGENDDSATLISFDIGSKQELARLQLNEYVNWAAFSQSGNYVVVESKTTSDGPRRLMRYSKLLAESMLLSAERHHGDLGLDENGDDVFVMIGGRFITYVRLKDAKKTQLPVSGYSRKAGHGHISCRNIKRPGWCYVSTYNNVVGAVRIAASNNLVGLGVPAIGADRGMAVFEHWGHHESNSENYPAQPKASASPTGKQIIFSSNWRGTEETNAYVLSRQVQ